jgi:hypothetical protein
VYFFAVVTPQGKLVSASRLEDPFLSECNHPHPYGMAADALGNVFIAFSGSHASNAPLSPLGPTLLVSYDRNGTLLWKKPLETTAGEIALTGGWLLQERSTRPVRTTTAEPLEEQGLIGRAVSTRSHYIHGPGIGGRGLFGFHVGDRQPAWSSPLSGVDVFSSMEIRLARWTSPSDNVPTTAVLGFVERGTTQLLHAVEAETGAPLWSCPLAHQGRTAPQLFEVAEGTLGLMDGATTCGACDPPYAGSRAAFHLWDIPGLAAPVDVPWPGTFGGAGHDHREKVLPPSP